MLPTVVIGSGPAGVAATKALIDADLPVTVIDAGDTIEAGRMEVFDTLARSEPEQWPSQLVQRVRGSFPVDLKHIPLKPAYGSLFPYVVEDPDLPIVCKQADVLASLAYGGLSNAWGAAILPLRQRDIEDWPISLAELVPHYEAVLRFVPMAAEKDDLSEILPLYTDASNALRRGDQAKTMLGHMRRHAEALRRSGIIFGASRLAVVASQESPRHCRHSGMCLYGCPYRSVYASSHTLDSLIRARRIDYRGGIYVDRLTEVDDSVVIDFHRRKHPTEVGRLTAARVFVACGALSSTQLMLDSLKSPTPNRRLADSQYFQIPMLTASATSVSAATQGNTLAQVFAELEAPRIAKHAVHLQIYGYNDLMLSALARRLPLSPARIEATLRPLFGRLVLVQGFLHSADSPGLVLERTAQHVRAIGEDTTLGTARVRRIVRRLAATARPLGMIPMPGLLMLGRPGKSNHVGGAMPMRHKPGAAETDMLGRPPAYKRVHVVDAAVFPSIPATTITLSVMANAHRIATVAARLLAADQPSS
jgi:choline dehydrogenase-like flavoprotein